MTTESKKLQTTEDGMHALSFVVSDKVLHDLRTAHELMDPSRKTPETPLEREQREVIRKILLELSDVLVSTGADVIHFCGDSFHDAIAAAVPYIQED